MERKFNADVYQQEWRKQNPDRVHAYQVKSMINRLRKEGYIVLPTDTKRAQIAEMLSVIDDNDVDHIKKITAAYYMQRGDRK